MFIDVIPHANYPVRAGAIAVFFTLTLLKVGDVFSYSQKTYKSLLQDVLFVLLTFYFLAFLFLILFHTLFSLILHFFVFFRFVVVLFVFSASLFAHILDGLHGQYNAYNTHQRHDGELNGIEIIEPFEHVK